MNNTSLNYRPDIDGVRAFAVMGVILFHLGIKDVPGGFVGVDVFYVLSGYLITSIIFSQASKKEFSFVEFYTRRARRLLPALFVLLLVVGVFSFLLLSPDHFRSSARSSFYAAISVSNINFWLESGYFDASKYTKPLLHTWSLGVEEQFYLVWPALVSASYFFRSRIVCAAVVLIISGLSFWGMLLVQEFDPSAAFYLSPFRAWQFGAGGLLAFVLVSDKAHPRALWTKALASLSTAAGLFMILWCFVRVDSNGYPGLAALWPTLATLLLIAGNKNILSDVVLSNSVSVFVGKISYSLYLWHWPVIIFIRYYTNAPLTVPLMGVALALSFLLGYLSYRFVESPLRKPWTRNEDRFAVPAGVATSIIALSLLSANAWAGDGWKWRLSEDAQAEIASMIVNKRLNCHKTEVATVTDACAFGVRRPNTEAVIFGDSHSSRLALGLQERFREERKEGMLVRFPGVVPFADVSTFVAGERRRAPVERGFDVIEALNPRLTIVHARFSLYWWTTEGDQSGEPPRTIGIVDPPASLAESQANFITGMEKAFDRLADYPGKVVIVGTIPFPGVDMQQCAQRPAFILSASQMIENCGGLERQDSIDRASAVNRVLEEAATSRGLLFVDPVELFCRDEGRYCMRIHDGKFVYDDDNHLNALGGQLLADFVLQKVEEQQSASDS